MFHVLFFLAVTFVSLACTTVPAYAYIGPAIVILGSLFGPVAAFVIMVILTLFYPILKLYKKFKKGSKKEQAEAGEEAEKQAEKEEQ